MINIAITFNPSGNEKDEQILDLAVLAIWLYIMTNINQALGIGYFAFIIFYWLMREEGKNVVYPLTKGSGEDFLISLAIGVFLGVLFLYGASSFFPGQTKVIGTALMDALNLTTMPIYLAILIGGLLVPYSEEKFFRGALLPLTTKYFGENVYINSGFNGAAFALWHMKVYSITNNPALLLAGVFGSLQSMITWKREDLQFQILAHCVYNSIIILSIYGMFGGLTTFLGL